MLVLRRYTFKLYPKPAQEAALRETASMCAHLWNALLQRREDVYRREHRTLTAFDLGKEITHLRAECPEWAAMPRTIQERVCGDLDNAFKAFFRRAREGAGAQAGYPRYKPSRDASAIPLREMVKGGWSFHPTVSAKVENGGCDAVPDGQISSDREAKFDSNSGAYPRAPSGQPENAVEAQDAAAQGDALASSGQPENAVEAQVDRVEQGQKAPGGQPESAKTAVNWRLYLKTVSGKIRARGRFPSSPRSIRTADINYRAGAWWLSVAVEIDRERSHGDHATKITFDLLDQFARVERAEGECVSPSRFSNAETTKRLDVSTTSTTSGAGAVETRAEHRQPRTTSIGSRGAGAVETRAEHRCVATASRSPCDTEPAETVDQIKSDRDRCFKRGSIRWRREKARVARLSAREARQRKEALHLWSTRIVADASTLSVTKPDIKKETASGRGNAARWGAAVEIKASLNRRILSMAPSIAVQMLSYKAAEAGIEIVLVEDEKPVIAVGNDLVASTRAARRARRTIRSEAA